MSEAKILSYGLMFLLATLVGCDGGDDGSGSGTPYPVDTQTDESEVDPANLQTPDPATGGTVTGKIAFEGTPPPHRSLKTAMQGTPFCKRHHKGEYPLDETVIVNDNKTLKNVVVSLEDVKGKWKIPSDPALLDQVGCMYVPHILTMRGRQKLVVKNSDKTNHNVHALPVKPGNRGFNQTQSRPKSDTFTTLRKTEMVPVKCDVHSWMGMVICVFEHPFFALTGDDGTYKLPAGIPPGKYTLKAWHEKLGTQTTEIEVKAGETTTAEDLTFKGS